MGNTRHSFPGRDALRTVPALLRHRVLSSPMRKDPRTEPTTYKLARVPRARSADSVASRVVWGGFGEAAGGCCPAGLQMGRCVHGGCGDLSLYNKRRLFSESSC